MFGILSLSVLAFVACKKESTTTTTDCTGATPTYINDVKVIMDASCAVSGCHNATSKAEGIDLSTYAKVKSESAKARFLGSIEHLAGYQAMPEGASKLSTAQIQTIACWIDNGTPE